MVGMPEIIPIFKLNITQVMAFETAKRGQLQEMHQLLNSKSLDDKRLALKKVIAQMTLGKDLSPLFQSVIKCLEHQDLDIKKLVYLYIINYSRVKPDDAIMSINLFRKDGINKTNPIIRALAVRTMSSLRVPNLNEYLVEPLKIALQDTDPYVRKTAVLSVPKIYEIAPEHPQTHNLVSELQKLVVVERNALVLANTIASLEQIRILSGKQQITMSTEILGRLLVAINECMEWAQVYILDYLCRYDPKTEDEAEMIIDRILPRLSHINPSVVFGCIKVVVRYLDFLSNADLKKNLSKKIGSSVISVVSFTQSEIQYVILKNIQYIIEKQPSIFQKDIKCFFCKFTDPHYIKIQKINILVRIVNSKNYEPVLEEIREYLTEIDSEFVKKCIEAIGKIAIRYEKSVEKCMGILAMKIKDTHAVAQHAENLVNEILVTTKNVLRKYPSKYNFNGMFGDLIALFDYATEPESKQASVWILGEYAQEIYSVAMNNFKRWMTEFKNEERIVQLEILSSAVKVFIKYPDEFETLISDLLNIATEEVDNPDVRDRAFIYWRMLSTDPGKSKNVIFGYRPQAKNNDKLMDPKFLREMMKSLGYTSSVFEKVPEELFQRSLAEMKGLQVNKPDTESQKSDNSDRQAESQSNKQQNNPSQLLGSLQLPVDQKEVAKQQNLLDLL